MTGDNKTSLISANRILQRKHTSFSPNMRSLLMCVRKISHVKFSNGQEKNPTGAKILQKIELSKNSAVILECDDLQNIPEDDRRRRRRLKGIHSRSDTNRTGAEGLSFYYFRLLYCLGQMLAVMSLSQHRVSSSKTVRPRAPCGARCIGHAVRTWSAVCSEAPHSQFGEGARPHLCMDEWNRPTPVRRRLSLTQAAQDKPIPTGLVPVPGTKARSLEAFSQYSAFHL